MASAVLIELLVLTLYFDAGSLLDTKTWWADMIIMSRYIPSLILVAAAATVVFGGDHLRRSLRELLHDSHAVAFWGYFLAHLAILALFIVATDFVMVGGIQSSSHPGAWAVSWLFLAGATPFLAVAAAMPPRLWSEFARRNRGCLLLGIGVGIAAWSAGQLMVLLAKPLGIGTFLLSGWMLQLITGVPLDYPKTWKADEFALGTPEFEVSIAPQCSGYEGIGLITVFLCVYLWLFRKQLRFPAALALLPLSIGAMWVANSVRITALIAVGTWISDEIALGAFHSQAGWLAFNAVAIGAIALTRHLRLFSKDSAAAREQNVTIPYLAPFVALLFTGMMTDAWSAGFDWAYPARVLIVGAVLWLNRRHYGGLFRSWSWVALVVGGLTSV
ncbi:MAG: archaeosortase/exosortase family protein, partial [Candidatus Acidiferrum sp.]